MPTVDHRLQLPAQAVSVRRARQFVGSALHRNGADGATDMCVLLTSELVTNAVLYGQSELGRDKIEVRIRFTPAMVRIGVHDQSPAPPVGCRVRPEATSGRGLCLVDAVSSAWGIDATDGGKEVWFALWR